MLFLCSISDGLEFWSENHSSMYENSELKDYKNIKFLEEIFNNWPNNLFGKNLYNFLDLRW